MTKRWEFIRNTIIPSVLAAALGVFATLFAAGKGVAAGISLAVLVVFALGYFVSLRISPRLGYLPWLWWRHWYLIASVLAMAALSFWLFNLLQTHSPTFVVAVDSLLILWGFIAALVVFSIGWSRISQFLFTRELPRAVGTASLEFKGKTEDRTSRGGIGPDGHLDAEFRLQFKLASSAERFNVIFIVLNRASATGKALGEIWTSDVLTSLWTLAVVDAETDASLNPDGRLELCSIQNQTAIRIFASDQSDTHSGWFTQGQQYQAMVYLSRRFYVTASTVI
jgi:hypothetical protein